MHKLQITLILLGGQDVVNQLQINYNQLSKDATATGKIIE